MTHHRFIAWCLDALNGGEFPHRFLNNVGNVLLVPMGACLLFWLASLTAGGPDATWSLGAALIATALLGSITASTARLPDKKRTYILRTLLFAVFVFFLGAVMQQRLPALVAGVTVLLMLIMVFSTRLMKRTLYAVWYRARDKHEVWLCIAVCVLGAGLWFLGQQWSWTAPAALAMLCVLHRARVWCTPRVDIPLSQGQHVSVWPRRALQESPMELWGSMLMYNHAWPEGIPHAALKATCAKLDVDGLLDYFEYYPMHPEAYPQPSQDFTRSIVERLQELDERAVVIFGAQSDDLPAAAQTLKDVRANKMAPEQTLELPEL